MTNNEKQIEVITRDDMLAAARIPDIFARQKRINEIVVGFANKTVRFDSTDALEVYYNVIHRLSGLSFNMKRTAYFNACENHMQLLRSNRTSAKDNSR